MAIYYVDNVSGNNANDGAIGTPWETISKANSTLTAGDTVYLRAGTYNESIAPANSGSTGNYITYENYQGEEATISGVNCAANLINRSYINLNHIRVIETTNGVSQALWVAMRHDTTDNHTHHNIIQNSYFEQTITRNTVWSGIYMKNANYNIVRGNYFKGMSGNPTGDLISVRGTSRYNIFENNEFHYCTHICLGIQGDNASTEFNVVRGNIFHNPWHTGMSFWLAANHNLIENNVFIDCGEEHDDNVNGSANDKAMTREQHKGFQIASEYIISRNNVSINNGQEIWAEATAANKRAYNCRIYNNTQYENYNGFVATGIGGPFGIIFKNNIATSCRLSSFYHNRDSSNCYVDNNNFTESTTFHTPANWTNNINVAPGFVDAVTHNFALASDSAMIDAGTFLTTTNGTGNASTTLIVDDALYFCDGWGIITGDTIQLEGQTTTAIITDITGSTLTIDTALTWTDGLGVALEYTGDAPDLGAFEFTEVVDPPDIPIPTIDDWIEAEETSAVITAPMVLVADGGVSGGYYVHTATNNSGIAFYSFNVTNSGIYRIKVSVYVTDGGSDSFFVKIDNDAEDIWDIFRGNSIYHGAWGVDLVSYRGTGTWDIPQYNPYSIQLSTGIHTIQFRGRDAGARIDRFYLESTNTVSLARGASRGVGRGILIGVI